MKQSHIRLGLRHEIWNRKQAQGTKCIMAVRAKIQVPGIFILFNPISIYIQHLIIIVKQQLTNALKYGTHARPARHTTHYEKKPSPLRLLSLCDFLIWSFTSMRYAMLLALLSIHVKTSSPHHPHPIRCVLSEQSSTFTPHRLVCHSSRKNPLLSALHTVLTVTLRHASLNWEN